MALEFILVFILAILAGGWSIAAGVLFGLDPILVYVAAVAGSLSFTLIILGLGGPAIEKALNRLMPDATNRVRESAAQDIIDRWGVIGLATIGGTLLGPAITLAAALLLRVNRRRFTIWYVLSTLIGLALLTAFWVLVTEN